MPCLYGKEGCPGLGVQLFKSEHPRCGLHAGLDVASASVRNSSSFSLSNSLLLTYFFSLVFSTSLGLGSDQPPPPVWGSLTPPGASSVIQSPSPNQSGASQFLAKMSYWHRENPCVKTYKYV